MVIQIPLSLFTSLVARVSTASLQAYAQEKLSYLRDRVAFLQVSITDAKIKKTLVRTIKEETDQSKMKNHIRDLKKNSVELGRSKSELPPQFLKRITNARYEPMIRTRSEWKLKKIDPKEEL